MLKRLPDAERERIASVIVRNWSRLKEAEGFIGAKPGFRVKGATLHREPVIIAVVRTKMSADYLDGNERLPSSLDGVPVDVVVSDPHTELELRGEQGLIDAELAEAPAPTYVGLPGDPINEPFQVDQPLLCHVGPDSGWVVLRDFVRETREALTAAMYDFSGDHIADALIDASLAFDFPIDLAIDDGITDAEELPIQKRLKLKLKGKYDAEIVVCRSGARFPSAYHEKVAVRDGSAFWLSSGNWTRSSQPLIDPVGTPADADAMYSKGNREWHVLVEHADLARLFARYIEHDRATAKADATEAFRRPLVYPDLFVPLAALLSETESAALVPPAPVEPRRLPESPGPFTVQPVLSPDNYAKRVRALIESAASRLYLQFAYINWSAAEKDRQFREVLEILAERSWRTDFDLRIIVNSRDAAQKVRVLSENGFNDAVFRGQGRIHNKGIVADGARVLVSSQNWSGDGFLRNRDAGLIIESPAVAQYYEAVFLDDWNHRTRPPFEHGLTGTIALSGEPTPPGMIRMSWRDYFGD